jgi:hypothetical protein
MAWTEMNFSKATGKSDISSGLFITVGVLALAWAIWTAGEYPGTGSYEVDIYKVYPISVWVMLLCAYLLGFISMLMDIYSSERSYKWLRGFALVTSVHVFIIALPFLRDYAFAAQVDSVVHASRVAGILDYGRPTATNFYPAAHILSAVYAMFSGFDANVAVVILPVFFYLFFLANIFFLAFSIGNTPRYHALIACLALPLVFGNYTPMFKPTHLAVYTMPLFIAWLYRSREKSRQLEDVIPFLIALFLFPFMHTLGVFAAAFLILMLIVAAYQINLHSPFRLSRMYTPLLAMCVLWLAWFGSFYVFNWTVRQFVEALFFEFSGRNMFNLYASASQRAALPLLEILRLVIFNYGHLFLYFIPAGIVILETVVRLVRRKNDIPVIRLALSGFAIGFGVMGVASVFRDLISFSPLRYWNYIVVITPLLVGKRAIALFRSTRVKDRLTIIGMGVVIVCGGLLGWVNSYDAPITGRPNLQFSYAQKSGIAFMLERAPMDDGKLIHAPIASYKNLDSVLTHRGKILLMWRNPTWSVQPTPDHFGYDLDDPQSGFANPGYLWVTAYERAFYTRVWPEGGRYTVQDFELLDDDPNWHMIYFSDGLSVWRKNSRDYIPGEW